jgi:hypothetical protein
MNAGTAMAQAASCEDVAGASGLAELLEIERIRRGREP